MQTVSEIFFQLSLSIWDIPNRNIELHQDSEEERKESANFQQGNKLMYKKVFGCERRKKSLQNHVIVLLYAISSYLYSWVCALPVCLSSPYASSLPRRTQESDKRDSFAWKKKGEIMCIQKEEEKRSWQCLNCIFYSYVFTSRSKASTFDAAENCNDFEVDNPSVKSIFAAFNALLLLQLKKWQGCLVR